jgi:hypothetical protein
MTSLPYHYPAFSHLHQSYHCDSLSLSVISENHFQLHERVIPHPFALEIHWRFFRRINFFTNNVQLLHLMIGVQGNDSQCPWYVKKSFAEISPGEIVFDKHHFLTTVPLIENIYQSG